MQTNHDQVMTLSDEMARESGRKRKSGAVTPRSFACADVAGTVPSARPPAVATASTLPPTQSSTFDPTYGLAALACTSAGSPRTFRSLANPPTRSAVKRAAAQSKQNQARRKRGGGTIAVATAVGTAPPRGSGRHNNCGDDRVYRVGRVAKDPESLMTLSMRVGMNDIVGRGGLPALFVNDIAGLKKCVSLVKAALETSGDTIGCLDAEWGPGRGNTPKERKGAWDCQRFCNSQFGALAQC